MHMRIGIAFGLGLVLAAAAAQAQYTNDVVKIGVLTDMNGVYSALAGPGSVKAAEMAVEDFTKTHKELAGKVQVVGADHQNKADIATNKASEMYDR
jgi:branched-chain amino acid transport system substrate-binding protein